MTVILQQYLITLSVEVVLALRTESVVKSFDRLDPALPLVEWLLGLRFPGTVL